MKIQNVLSFTVIRRISLGVTIASIIFALGSASAATYTPPPAGLISWWKADGNANDSVGGHNGTLEGGMGFTTGISGSAFAAGSNKRVFVPDSPDFQLTSLSIGAWVNIAQNSWDIFFRGDNRTGLDPYVLALDNNGHVGFGIGSATASDGIQSGISYQQWHQVTATLDNATHDMRLYIDGGLVAEKTTSVVPLLALDPSQVPGLGLGNVQDLYDFPLIGSLDEVVLYNRALTPAEVTVLATVPEPTSAALLICGLGALAVRNLRSRKQ
jgi:hypothetical protein